MHPPSALAHESAFPFRFVAPDGVDDGDCDDPAVPCQTILYAINQALPGDQVRVAAGTYLFDSTNLPLLLSKIIPVKGGYNSGDGFTVQNPIQNPTYLLGLEAEYRDEIAVKGFNLLQDAKAIELGGLSGGQITPTLAAQNGLTTFARCLAGQADIYPCQGIDLLARMPLDAFKLQPGAANDIWGFVDQSDGREYAIIGLQNGTAVVDVTNPLQPIEIGAIPGTPTIWRDLKVYQLFDDSTGRWQAYAYVTADSVTDGLQIIDLSDLPDSISLAATYTGFQRAHNIYLSNIDYTTGITQSGPTAYAYILGSELGKNSHTGGVRILDLSEPTAPVEIAAPPEADYVHDGATLVIGDTRTADCQNHNPCELFIDFNEKTVDLWDVTNKATPYRISSTPYNGSRYTHSGWGSTDTMYVFIQDELDERGLGHNTRLRVLDISDLKTPFVSRIWEGPTRAIDHNGFSLVTHYYMSNYERGLTILDIAEPNQLHDIAFFDTYPGSDSPNFNGAWGVYPYLPSGTILVSDIESGLFLLREQGLAISKSGPERVESGEPITYTLTITNNGLYAANNLVITDTLPTGAIYLSGGTRVGDVISWSIPSLAPGTMTQTIFAIFTTTNTFLTNDTYDVRAEGSVTASGRVNVPGSQSVVTLVGGVDVYLPLILKN